MPFAIGVVWWDYWLPLLAAFNNRKILMLDRPGTVHLSHKQGNKAAVWREFAAFFAAYAVSQSETASRKLPEIVTAIHPLCREIAALNREGLTNTPQYDARLTDLMDVFSRQIRKNANVRKSNTGAALKAQEVRPPSPQDGALTTANVFRRFEARAAAGQAVLRAKRLLNENKLADAEDELAVALAETPDDFEALLISGETALRRGELEAAHRMLTKAGEQKPFATRRLQLSAAVLHANGKRDEAIECFRNILQTNPGFQPAYTDIAIVLWEENRRDEAFAYIGQALQHWPDLRIAAELHDRFSKQAGLPVRPRQDQSQLGQPKSLLRWLSRAISRAINRRTRF
jgi:tetratricopeptide (TPR) repeat protein